MSVDGSDGGFAREEGGTYTLLVELPEGTYLEIGALGTRTLDAGWYAYTGSALGSGASRASSATSNSRPASGRPTSGTRRRGGRFSPLLPTHTGRSVAGSRRTAADGPRDGESERQPF
jgi:hypothetical protein